MGRTKIEWAATRDQHGNLVRPGRTWNPVTGCSKVSPGCLHCYAERMARRQQGRNGYPADEPFRVTLHPDRLEEPFKVKEPTTWFVCSMSDLFHENVPFEYVARVFQVMSDTPHHTYQVLSKRPGRMAYFAARAWPHWLAHHELPKDGGLWHDTPAQWPRNVWAGTSVEEQKYAPRLDVLARVPAPVRFLSAEPLLGPLELARWLGNKRWEPPYEIGRPVLSWVIVGGESGPGARPMHPEWVRSIRDQCEAAMVPFFFKQWGEWLPRFSGTVSDSGAIVDYIHPTTGERMAYILERVGKKAAGALLDGRPWRQMPDLVRG